MNNQKTETITAISLELEEMSTEDLEKICGGVSLEPPRLTGGLSTNIINSTANLFVNLYAIPVKVNLNLEDIGEEKDLLSVTGQIN